MPMTVTMAPKGIQKDIVLAIAIVSSVKHFFFVCLRSLPRTCNVVTSKCFLFYSKELELAGSVREFGEQGEVRE